MLLRIVVGERALQKQGFAPINIGRLPEFLAVTRPSFYHHSYQRCCRLPLRTRKQLTSIPDTMRVDGPGQRQSTGASYFPQPNEGKVRSSATAVRSLVVGGVSPPLPPERQQIRRIKRICNFPPYSSTGGREWTRILFYMKPYPPPPQMLLYSSLH